jgi:hypothetical protein
MVTNRAQVSVAWRKWVAAWGAAAAQLNSPDDVSVDQRAATCTWPIRLNRQVAMIPMITAAEFSFGAMSSGDTDNL